MEVFAWMLTRYRQFALRFSIFDRVLIGNSIIIIFGAVAGTIITRQMVLFGNIWLILLFSFVGILITLLVNRIIIRTALEPLHELGDAIEQVHGGQITIPETLKTYQDPDIRRLVAAIDAMLNRITYHTQQLRAISERAISAQEAERVRIARSLHDDTAQSISMLIIHLERLGHLVPPDEPEIMRFVVDAENVANQLLENLRKIIWDLRPSILDDLGLVSAIRWFARTNLEKVGVKVEFSTDSEILRLPSYLETMLFRMAQEAISNILRHADASKVSIRLCIAEAHLWLEVKDDGRGFDLEQAAETAVDGKRLGLLGMQERAALVGGEVNIESARDFGTCLQVQIPLPVEALTSDGRDAAILPEGRV